MTTDSPGWLGFLIASIITMVILLFIKSWQIYKFDLIRMVYNYHHGKYDFNVSNWLIFHLLWACLVHGHYYFFNFVFRGNTEPCVGNLNSFASTEKLFNDLPQVLL